MVKILKFLDMHPRSRTRDEKNSNLGSEIQDGKNLDPVSWIRDGKHSDSGFRIRDKHPRSAKLEISSPNLLGLKNQIIIKPFVEKAFCDKTKPFLQSKVASVASERGKTPLNWIFQSPTRLGRRAELRPQGRNRYCSLPS